MISSAAGIQNNGNATDFTITISEADPYVVYAEAIKNARYPCRSNRRRSEAETYVWPKKRRAWSYRPEDLVEERKILLASLPNGQEWRVYLENLFRNLPDLP